MFVARHCPSKTLVVVKQTNVDVKSAEQLEELKVRAVRVCGHFGAFEEKIFLLNLISSLDILFNFCLQYEVKVLRSLCHPNILPFYCSFVNRQEVWHVLPLMQFGMY